jgi:hypothetical protein
MGPRRPLRRAVPPGMLGRNEQLIPVAGETGRWSRPLGHVRHHFTAPMFHAVMKRRNPGRARFK